MKKIFSDTEIEERPFHTLRHFCKKMMSETGIDSATIQTVGRWKGFETILKYCYTTCSQEHDAVKNFHQNSRKERRKRTD